MKDQRKDDEKDPRESFNPTDSKIDYIQLWEQGEKERLAKWDRTRENWWKWSREVTNGDKAYSPWLVIPADYADYGIRPLHYPHWRSPFIHVISPDPSGQPKAGEENYIVAEVFNVGMATSAPTKVDFYWADPSVGLNAANFHHIGTEWIEVPPMGRKAVRCSVPWIPEYLNNGHECLMVNTDNRVLDPIAVPFKPKYDRHVGQRNVSVLPADSNKFKFWAPMGYNNMDAEIWVTALKIKAYKGFKVKTNPTASFLEGASRALVEYRLLLDKKLDSKNLEKLGMSIQKLSAKEVIREMNETKNRRFIKTEDEKEEINEKDSGQKTELIHFGEPMLTLKSQKSREAVEIELLFESMPVEKDEILVLEIGHILNGQSTDGYTLILANPDALGTSNARLTNEQTVKSNNMNTKSLEQLIIERNPETRISYQLAKQMADHLPIKSYESLQKSMGEGILIDDQRLKLAMFQPYIPKSIFPIEDLEDLVLKLSSATTIALEAITKETAVSTENKGVQDILKTGLGQNNQQQTSIPAGHFTGPSIYGYELSKKYSI